MIREDLEGFFTSPHDHPAKWLFMLTAYVDESGHEGRDWVFVAGLLGNDDQWRHLAAEWRYALGNRKKFHMRSLRWKHRRTKKLLEALGPLPAKCGLQRIMGGIKVSEYADLIGTGPMNEQALKGYVLALLGMIYQVLRHLPKGERLEIVFEQQKQYQPLAQELLSMVAIEDHALDENRHRGSELRKVKLVPKDSTILTQPADYMAYAVLQHYRDSSSQRAQWCKSILRSGDGTAIGDVISRQRIRKYIARAQLDGIAKQLREKYGVEIFRNLSLH